MHVGLLRDLLTVLAGIATGLMSGAFGVGGAVISTPAIRALGCSAALAVGTTLPSILPGALTGAYKYRSQNLIQWTIVRVTVPAGIVAAVAGARLADVLPGGGHPLMILTAMLLMYTATNMIRGVRHSTTESTSHVFGSEPLTGALIGVIAGGMSGLLGIGGGILMVPLFRKLMGLQMKAATATSLVCVGLFATPGTITHALQQGLDWRIALCLTLGVVPAAPFGAKAALALSDANLRRVFGVFLAVIATIYGGGEIVALFH